MLDPGAFGALIVGLDTVHAEADRGRRRHPVTPSRRARGGGRVAIARGLRRAAAWLDRPMAGTDTVG